MFVLKVTSQPNYAYLRFEILEGYTIYNLFCYKSSIFLIEIAIVCVKA